jgi:hypothetical protein
LVISVRKSRTIAAAAAGASYLAAKESIKRSVFQKSAPTATAAGAPY